MTVHNGKYEQLLAVIAAQRTVAVAFSGGVDSSFLCYAAHEALGDKALAVTVVSPMLPKSEIAFAKRVGAQIGRADALPRGPGNFFSLK
ncbi:asparagine synthase-related protein, partial [Treponema endosymbiont of Eucomonympha sp.]|uniref:asparagine synthase-related protein n=1 Tax=Treponema endosymbiont of Eucomonympha sp. TaxID=1580831 RepID=UPI000ABE0B55